MPATQPRAASNDLAKNVKEARVAARAMAALSAADREKALSAMRASLEQQRDVIEKANAIDIANAKKNSLSDALQGRLNVSGKKFDGMLSKVDEVKAVPDPLGVVSRKTELDKGLELSRVACPIGVICVIFESRPEAAVQIASLTIRSGNAVILKGGKEAANTNAALVHAMQCGLTASGVMPASAVQLVQTREEIGELLNMHGQIDLIVPRGSNELVSHIMKNTSIPVLGHADGICSVYLDESAVVETAVRVAVDSKIDYPVACNAAEKLVVHRGALKTALPAVCEALLAKGVELRADDESFALLSARVPEAVREGKLKRATPPDFRTEFGGLVMAVKVVENLGDAANHINEHSSHHTDCIVAADAAAVEYFMRHIDSAGVYANASTRFADGQRYGFGAEVGVSTNRIHARGPVGVEGLLIYKYLLYGEGQIVAEYSSGAKSFKHNQLPLDKDAKPEFSLGARGVLVVAAAAVAGGAMLGMRLRR
jgi:glutamate-5-semialdehyde dehydrogenase